MTNKDPKWFSRFIKLLESCWENHGPCKHLFHACEFQKEEREWNITIAPVFQEVFGGEEDGQKVWTGFIFHSDIFYASEGIHVEHFAAASLCSECSPTPRLMFKCKYKGHKIYLTILLEPPPEAVAVEIIDTIHKKILDKPPEIKKND